LSPAAGPIDAVRRVIAQAIKARVFPAAAIEVGTTDQVLWAEAFGTLTYDPNARRATVGTVFDLASLTKVIATSTVAMRLFEQGVMPLDSPIGAWVPGWRNADRMAVTVRDLLEHCAGLPAHAPLYETCATPADFISAINRCPLEYPPRHTSIYSDLGFILLGCALEAAGGASLDRQLAVILGTAFGDADAVVLAYRPPREWLERMAPTRVVARRGGLLAGEVDDDNAWALGGVAGHAGLFGTAGAVGQFARAVMRALHSDVTTAGQLAGTETMKMFVTPSAVAGSSRAIGWDTMRPTSSCGARMSAQAFGHTGFTGTSLWIDPATGLYVVLLTNRVHPEAGRPDSIQAVRRAVHDAAIAALPRPAKDRSDLISN
jgi:CubicO group peptidase (beta-lactamase class C family)